MSSFEQIILSNQDVQTVSEPQSLQIFDQEEFLYHTQTLDKVQMFHVPRQAVWTTRTYSTYRVQKVHLHAFVPPMNHKHIHSLRDTQQVQDIKVLLNDTF